MDDQIEAAKAALIKAHESGNTAHAKIIADHIIGMQSTADASAYAGGRDVKDMGIAARLYGGMNVGARELVAGVQNLLPNGANKFLDEKLWDGKMSDTIKQGRAFIREGGLPARLGASINEATPNITAGALTGGMSFLPRAMIQYGTSYATTNGDNAQRNMHGLLAAGGEALPAVGLALAKGAVNTTDAARRLIDQGVYPTMGQASGGLLKTFEDLSTSIPGVGHFINRGRNAAMNEGVAAGQAAGRVPGITSSGAGFENNKVINNYFDQAYPNVTRPLKANLDDPAFIQAMGDTFRNNNVSMAGREDVRMVLDNARIDGSGMIRGADVHSLIQALRGRSSGLKISDDPYHRATGMAFSDVRNALNDTMLGAGTTPKAMLDFNALNNQYRMTAPSMKASESAAAARNDGLYTPVQFANSVTGNAKAQGNRSLVRTGEAPGQALANDMVNVLGRNYPDSGTAARTMWGSMLNNIPGAAGAGITGALAGFAPTALTLGAATSLASALYSQGGRKFMLGATPGQAAFRDALRGIDAQQLLGTAGAAGFANSP